MSPEYNISVELINEKVQFRASNSKNAAIQTDYSQPIGDDNGYTSLELLLISLANCSATSIVLLLRKMRKTVSGFSVHATADRAVTHPTVLTKIYLNFTLTSPDTLQADLDKAISISEESLCPVWAMLKPSTQIEVTSSIS
ncbi:MAG: OsmC family protein [Ignavibacteria bacterium]|nr:OsmC family protein [Ignavibacteria bacterium]